MGHLINPIAFRLGLLDNVWVDSWFFKRLYYSEFLHTSKLLKEFIEFFFWDTKLKYKYIHSHTELFKLSDKFILTLYGYDSKLENLIDRRLLFFFKFRKRQEFKFFNFFFTFAKLTSNGFFFRKTLLNEFNFKKSNFFYFKDFFSSFYSNRRFYLVWKIFIFGFFLKWKLRRKLLTNLSKFFFAEVSWLKKDLLLSKRTRKFYFFKFNLFKIVRKIKWFKLRKFNPKFNNLTTFMHIYNWSLFDFFNVKKRNLSLSFFSTYKCKWFLKFFYFVSILINFTVNNAPNIMKLQHLYSLRLKGSIRKRRRFAFFDFYLDPILYPVFRQAFLLQLKSVGNYDLYSKFLSLIASLLVPTNFDVRILSMDNAQIDAKFLAQFISIKFTQGFYLWDIIGPIFRELNNLRRSDKLLGYKLTINGRLSRRSKTVRRTYFRGKMSSSTIDTKIDYFFTSSSLKNGAIGIKVWLNKPTFWRSSLIKLN